MIVLKIYYFNVNIIYHAYDMSFQETTDLTLNLLIMVDLPPWTINLYRFCKQKQAKSRFTDLFRLGSITYDMVFAYAPTPHVWWMGEVRP